MKRVAECADEEKQTFLTHQDMSRIVSLAKSDNNVKFLDRPDLANNPNGSIYSVVPSENKIAGSRTKMAGFFTDSRLDTKSNSFKMPKCKVSRGVSMGIFFLILFCLLIIWFLFSNEHMDDEFESFPPTLNGTNLTDTHSMGNQLFPRGIGQMEHSKLFVVVATVLIVLSIIVFVFVGSLIQYFRNPDLYANQSLSEPTPKNAFTSIFSSHRSVRNDLYYLDLNMKNSQLKEENEKNEPLKPKKQKSDIKAKTNTNSLVLK